MRSEDFKIVPEANEKIEARGFEHFGYVYENVQSGQEFKFTVKYIKHDSQPSQDIKYFVDKYGDDAKITPMQRIQGKFYQYTRGFDTLEWAVFWGVIGVWLLALFFAIYLLTRKFLKKGIST